MLAGLFSDPLRGLGNSRNLGNSHGYGIDGPVKFDDLHVESLKLLIFILMFHMLNSQRVNEHHEHTA